MGASLHLLYYLNQVHSGHVMKKVDRELGDVVAVLKRNFEQVDKSDLFALVLCSERATLS